MKEEKLRPFAKERECGPLVKEDVQDDHHNCYQCRGCILETRQKISHLEKLLADERTGADELAEALMPFAGSSHKPRKNSCNFCGMTYPCDGATANEALAKHRQRREEKP